MSLLRRLLSSIFILSLLVPAYAEVELPPAVSSPKDKISLLLAVQQYIPFLLQEGAEYDVDFFNILERNNVIVKGLKQNSEFKRLSKSKPELLRIELQLNSGTARAAQEVRQYDLSALETARSRQPVADLKALQSDLSALEEARSKRDPRKALQGLIGLVADANTKRSLFTERNPLKRIKSLKSNLLPEATLTRFNRAVHNFEPNATLEQMKAQLTADFALEERILAGATKLSATELSQLAQMNGEQFVGDLNKVLGRSNAAKQTANEIANLFQTYLKEHDLSPPKAEKLQTAQPAQSDLSLTILEVPPVLGIFRGLVGGDCATSFSFPYVYMPYESTFYIYDIAKNLVGYASLTEVRTAKGERAWYLHDITGLYMSRASMEHIVRGLYLAGRQIGFKDIYVGDQDKISEHISHKSIIEGLAAFGAQSDDESISYLDDNVRQLITNMDSGITNSYDLASNNQTARKVKIRQEDLSNYSIKISAADSFSMTRNKPTNGEIALMALDTLTSGRMRSAIESVQVSLQDVRDSGFGASALDFNMREQAAQFIANEYKIDYQKVDTLNAALQNPSALPVAQYYNQLRPLFAELDIDLNSKLIEDRPYLFQEGHLNAPDASTNVEQRKQYEIFVFGLFERFEMSSAARNHLSANHEILFASQRFEKMVKHLARGTESSWKKLNYLNTIDSDRVAGILATLGHQFLESALERSKKFRARVKPVITAALKKASQLPNINCDRALTGTDGK